jgi:hypothetical protein
MSLCIRVSPKGKQYIQSARPDHQPALILPLTDEMVEDEEQQCTTGGVGELNSMATFECEQLSEVDILSPSPFPFSFIVIVYDIVRGICWWKGIRASIVR